MKKWNDNEFIHRHRAKWLFIERGRSMTGHSIGVVEAPWWSPDPVSARRLTKYWSVSSAGRPDGIDFQTNVDWISTKMNDAQQVPRGYLHAPAGITCYLHLCIRPVRSLSQPRFSGESSVLQKLFHPRETGLINRCVTSRRITRLRFLAYTRPNIRNKRPSLRRSIFSFKGNSWNLSNFHFGAASTFRLYALLMSLPLLLFFF